jgi:hypothetical protein
MAKTSFNNLLAEYNASLQNIENLKKELYIAAMHGNLAMVENLREVIIKYEADMRVFTQQRIEYKHVGEK